MCECVRGEERVTEEEETVWIVMRWVEGVREEGETVWIVMRWGRE